MIFGSFDCFLRGCPKIGVIKHRTVNLTLLSPRLQENLESSGYMGASDIHGVKEGYVNIPLLVSLSFLLLFAAFFRNANEIFIQSSSCNIWPIKTSATVILSSHFKNIFIRSLEIFLIRAKLHTTD